MGEAGLFCFVCVKALGGVTVVGGVTLCVTTVGGLIAGGIMGDTVALLLFDNTGDSYLFGLTFSPLNFFFKSEWDK